MASFSSWGDEKVSAQRALLTDLLRGSLGFDGFVVSDWGAVDQIDPGTTGAVRRAVDAGIDMNMVPTTRPVMWEVAHAVETGALSMARVDEAAFRIVRVKFMMGLFETPFSDPALLAEIGSEEHRALARRAVSESLVLLKTTARSPSPTSRRSSSCGQRRRRCWPPGRRLDSDDDGRPGRSWEAPRSCKPSRSAPRKAPQSSSTATVG